MPDDAATAQRAIEIAFPTLRVATCRYLSEGWDSSAWEVNDSLVFRFPSAPKRRLATPRDRAAPLARRRPPRADSALHPHRHAGAPNDPALPFVGYPKLAGRFLDQSPELLHPASPLLPHLAAFLRALHAFPLDRAVACGVTPGSWVAWRDHWHAFAARAMRDDDPALDPPTRAWVAATCDAFLAELARAERPVALLHHDLALEHILVDPPGERITGVIDWGDVWIGDPALDFAAFAHDCDPATLDALLAATASQTTAFAAAPPVRHPRPFPLLHFGLHLNDPARIAEAHTAIRAAATIPTH
ncbi:MAG: aminoglycoside phosphotransferase family protein [Chloroflexia bacterium]